MTAPHHFNPKEHDMADEDEDPESGEGGGIDGEYKRPDAALAFKIYDQQIAQKLEHLATIKGDLSQPWQDVKDQAHFPKKVLNFIVALEDMEDAKRDHFLLALSEGLRHRKLFLPRDLVTMANGEDGDELVPTGEREAAGLATLDDGFETGADELALQAGRPSTEQAKAEAEEAGENKNLRRGRRAAKLPVEAEGAAVH